MFPPSPNAYELPVESYHTRSASLFIKCTDSKCPILYKGCFTLCIARYHALCKHRPPDHCWGLSGFVLTFLDISSVCPGHPAFTHFVPAAIRRFGAAVRSSGSFFPARRRRFLAPTFFPSLPSLCSPPSLSRPSTAAVVSNTLSAARNFHQVCKRFLS